MPEKDPNKIPRNPAGRTPKQTLRDLTANVAPASGRLSLVHVTSTGYASEILRDEQISTRECDVFKRHLVYLFLCQATYRRKDWEQKSKDLSIFPVAFVLDPTKVGDPYQMYPFDTGAAVNGLYRGARADGVYLEDFALSQDLDSARKFIAWAFGSLNGYLDRKLNDEAALSETYEHWDFVQERFIHIARQAAPGQNEHPDGRAASIEVAYDKHVTLHSAVRCVIVPDAFLESARTKNKNPVLTKFLKTSDAAIRVYKWRPNDAPNWHMAEIERLCREEMET
jgi:hypothetical protein